MTDVAVLGAGSWGTALADLLARKGLRTKLWAFEHEVSSASTARDTWLGTAEQIIDAPVTTSARSLLEVSRVSSDSPAK